MNPESTFTNSKGETMSFIDYYKRQYQIDIQDRKQPLLVNRPTLKKRGLAEAEADRVHGMLQHWANQAVKYSRQRHHVALDVDADSMPSDDVVRAQAIEDATETLSAATFQKGSVS